MAFSSYLGRNTAKMDSTWRFTIASTKSTWASLLGDNYIICKGLKDHCLYVMDRESFDTFSYTVYQMDFDDYLEYSGDFHSYAYEVKSDKQGRLRIPEALHEFLTMADPEDKEHNELQLVGAGMFIEVWEKKQYEIDRAARKASGRDPLKAHLKFAGVKPPMQKNEV